MLEICIILFSALTSSYGLETIPLFLIDDGLLDGKINPQTNPFINIEKDEFASIVDVIQERSESIIFFIEENFCMEDVTNKDNKGTPFVNLHKAFKNKKVKQFLRVIDPYPYFKIRFPAFEFNTFHIRSTTTKLRLEENYKFMYVFFDDVVNETRTQQLRRHDTIINEVCFIVKQFARGPIMAIYTGKINPVDISGTVSKTVVPEVEKPKVSRTDDCKWELIKCDGNVMFQLCGAKISDIKTLDLNPRDCVLEDKDGYITYFIKVDTEESPKRYQIGFKFQRIKPPEGEIWKLILLSFLNDEGALFGEKTMDIELKLGATYNSVAPIVLQKDPSSGGLNARLDILKYAISVNASDGGDGVGGEPVADPGLGGKPVEDPGLGGKPVEDPGLGGKPVEDPGVGGKPVDPNILRVGPSTSDENSTKTDDTKKGTEDGIETFINAPILMGLLVTIIFLSILSWGISNLMNIQTNSRYDSPDSKPLFNPDTVGE